MAILGQCPKGEPSPLKRTNLCGLKQNVCLLVLLLAYVHKAFLGDGAHFLFLCPSSQAKAQSPRANIPN